MSITNGGKALEIISISTFGNSFLNQTWKKIKWQ